jgi:NAD+ kinase
MLAAGNPAVISVMEAYEAHNRTIELLETWLKGRGVSWTRVLREDFDGVDDDIDLVVAVGGDGTVLDAARRVIHTPVLGINSDPARSIGSLCAAKPDSMTATLDAAMEGRSEPISLVRMRVRVGETELPTMVLNDVLLAHPNPAATSRYLMTQGEISERQLSSGVWVATPAGSSGALRSAGGTPMPRASERLQWRAREPYEPVGRPPYQLAAGFVEPGESLEVVWGARRGNVYLDGAHLSHPVRLGERVCLSADAPRLRLHAPIKNLGASH